uniref:Tail tape measure protein n=1 Tax=Dulem virus 33 TaxID=3145751 RepID=A0AAU8B5S8_9CAUD
MTTALVKGVSETAEYGDNIDKMSQKMGLSAEAYQEWDAILQHSGSSIETMKASMKTLATAAETGSAAFEQLGLSQEAIAEMSQEDLFGATISALQNVESETERTYLAGQLLGRGATELGALLNTSAEDTEAMRQRVHELGGVMSDEAVKAAAAYQDSLQDMQTAFSGLSRNMLGNFLPAITTVMDGLTEIFAGNGNEGISLVTDGLNQFMDNINQAIPQMLETGKQIIDSLLGVIMENIPSLLSAGTEVITEILLGIAEYIPELATGAIAIVNQIVDSIVDNLPMLLTAALETIMALANGIAESLPELIPTIVDVVLQIVETLIDNVDMLVDAAIEIIIALAEGLIYAVPKLIAKAPEIIAKLVMALITNAPKLLEAAVEIIAKLAAGIITNIPNLVKAIPQVVAAIVSGFSSLMSSFIDIGKNIVNGVWQGIQNMASWITSKVKGFFSGIVNGVKSVLGIASPSKVFASIGGYMAEGLGEGWDDEYSNLKKQIEGDMNFGTATVDFASSGVGRYSGAMQSAFSNLAASMEQNATIVVQSVLDGKVIGEASYQYARNKERAYGLA